MDNEHERLTEYTFERKYTLLVEYVIYYPKFSFFLTYQQFNLFSVNFADLSFQLYF